MNTERSPEDTPRRLLAFGCWLFVGFLVGFVVMAAIPPLYKAFEVGQPLGPVAGALGGLIILVAMFAILIGGIWHVAVTPSFYSDGHRYMVIFLLLIGNIFAGLAYYFGYVYFRRRAQIRNAAV